MIFISVNGYCLDCNLTQQKYPVETYSSRKISNEQSNDNALKIILDEKGEVINEEG
jgi:hypothetical protein